MTITRFARLSFLTTCLSLVVVVSSGSTCGQPLFSIGGAAAAKVTVRVKADYGVDPAAKHKRAAKSTCGSGPQTQDGPDLVAGSDCDGDAGVVAYITPSKLKVALKRLAFVRKSDGALIDIVPDSKALAASTVMDLASPVTLPDETLAADTYTDFVAEVYYYELTMPLYDAAQPVTLRVYVSDDDFPAEGSLGHHQGDITLLDDDGNELGFVDGANLWVPNALTPDRGTINGAGGTDAETGHLRGLYGDTNQWDQHAFVQGPEQDIYRVSGPLNLVISGDAREVTLSFDMNDAWYYEDFNLDDLFDPCDPMDACAAGAEWSPIFNPPLVDIAEATDDQTAGK